MGAIHHFSYLLLVWYFIEETPCGIPFNALKKGNQNESASLLVQGAYNSITNNTYNYFLIILVIIVIKMINLFYSSALKIDGIKTLILSILKKKSQILSVRSPEKRHSSFFPLSRWMIRPLLCYFWCNCDSTKTCSLRGIGKQNELKHKLDHFYDKRFLAKVLDH